MNPKKGMKPHNEHLVKILKEQLQKQPDMTVTEAVKFIFHKGIKTSKGEDYIYQSLKLYYEIAKKG